ncbi:MAG: hypothetical protein VCB99_12595 [Myxococcota bacterium]
MAKQRVFEQPGLDRGLDDRPREISRLRPAAYAPGANGGRNGDATDPVEGHLLLSLEGPGLALGPARETRRRVLEFLEAAFDLGGQAISPKHIKWGTIRVGHQPTRCAAAIAGSGPKRERGD